ncbi:MAG: M48 family metallopeptidase [Candidatus Acidiferrales bacterium]
MGKQFLLRGLTMVVSALMVPVPGLLASVPRAQQTAQQGPSQTTQSSQTAPSAQPSPAPAPSGAAPAAQQSGTQSSTPAPSTAASPSQTPDGQSGDTSAPATTGDASQPAAEPGVKPGSKQDVNAIGNRSVGKGLDFYSLEHEIALGKQLAQEVDKSAKFIDDPVVVEYVNRVGQNLVRNSDARVPFTIKVIDSDQVNAFALPGGFFYVNSGLILHADEESELAGVMAHEIAHVCARHGTKQQTKGDIVQAGAMVAMIFIPYSWAGYAMYEGMQFAIPMTFLKFSRADEAEADYLGLQYMYKAGYDPNSFVTFFEKVEALEKKQPGTIPKFFSTHPPTPERIVACQKEISTILPSRPEYIVSTSEFDMVKARLQMLENNEKVDKKKAGGPSLRHKTQTNKPSDPNSTADGSDTDDPDKPTLKRRPDDGTNP